MTVEELMDILKQAKPTAKITLCDGDNDYDIMTGYSIGIVVDYDEVNNESDELYLDICRVK